MLHASAMTSPKKIIAMGARIRERRRLLGVSQERLGAMVQEVTGREAFARMNVSKWERDVAVPDRGNLAALAQIFDVSEAWLEYGDEALSTVTEHESSSLAALSDEDLAIEGVRRDEARDGRGLTDEEAEHLRETFRATQLSIGVMSSEDAIRDLKIALRRFRAGQVEDYSRPSTPARDRLLVRKPKK